MITNQEALFLPTSRLIGGRLLVCCLARPRRVSHIIFACREPVALDHSNRRLDDLLRNFVVEFVGVCDSVGIFLEFTKDSPILRLARRS